MKRAELAALEKQKEQAETQQKKEYEELKAQIRKELEEEMKRAE